MTCAEGLGVVELKINLYELLRVSAHASVAEIQAAYRRTIREIESSGKNLSAPENAERGRLLRIALNTLTDPVSRISYDRTLAAARPGRAAVAEALSLVPLGEDAADAGARADALSLRADALALRADAILIRAGRKSSSADTMITAGGAVLWALKYFTRIIGILVLVAIAAFSITRCSVGGASVNKSDAAHAKAREQTAIQDYFQTHGVRPANIAELELLEADRRRRENKSREGNQDRDKQERKQEREARQFEEESRRLANEVSAKLRSDESNARWQAEREKEQQRDQANAERAAEQAERARAEQQKREWRDYLRQ